jgi:hypothetical protein
MKFILDLPARASITKTKLLGYYGCPLCEIKGTVFKSSVYYPGEQNAPRRTDESFKAKTASAFHKGTSILEELNIGMLTSIPLDPMHTVDEGIVMKYLGILKSNRTLFGAKELDFKHINEAQNRCSETQPREFNRKIRDFEYLGFFKATEYRMFILFTGVVSMLTFNDKFRSDIYQNFLLLSVACRICSNEEYSNYVHIAEKMFNKFVDNFTIQFGMNNVTWKVHAARHLAEEVRRHGVFKNFSAYEFESFMNTIKTNLHTHTLPLQQIHRRIIEIHTSKQLFKKKKLNPIKFGKSLKGDEKNCFNFLWCKGTFFSAKFKDSWFLTKAKDIIQIKNIMKKDSGHALLLCVKCLNKDDFFTNPTRSSYVDIYKINLQQLSTQTISLTPLDIRCKMFAIRLDNVTKDYVLIAMSNI